MKGIVIKTDQTMAVHEFTRPLHKSLGAAVGGYIEHVHPMMLSWPLCLIVNEEGK